MHGLDELDGALVRCAQHEIVAALAGLDHVRGASGSARTARAGMRFAKSPPKVLRNTSCTEREWLCTVITASTPDGLEQLRVEQRAERLTVELFVVFDVARVRRVSVLGPRSAILRRVEQVGLDQDDLGRAVVLGGARDQEVALRQRLPTCGCRCRPRRSPRWRRRAGGRCRSRSCSSEMKRGQNSPLAKFLSETMSERSVSCPNEWPTSMANGSSETLPTMMTRLMAPSVAHGASVVQRDARSTTHRPTSHFDDSIEALEERPDCAGAQSARICAHTPRSRTRRPDSPTRTRGSARSRGQRARSPSNRCARARAPATASPSS